MVISTGTTLPTCACVAALYCLTNSMMFTACGPSAVPTGGAGLASRELDLDHRRHTTAAAGWLRWHLPACSLDSSLALAALQLLHLVERKLHRGLAAQDRHQHLDLLLVRVDLGDRAGQLRERPRRHG